MILLYFAKMIDDSVLALEEAFARRCQQLARNNLMIRGIRSAVAASRRRHLGRRALPPAQNANGYALQPACASFDR